MTEKEAIEYIENQGWSTTRLGLSRTRELLRLLGDPQKKLKFVHVAGSNGKGSTCAMLDSILRAAGYRTGLYTSPYIERFNERIQVDGESISGAELAGLTERVGALADGMADHPSQFELITAIALQYFFERRCDIVVLEVGLGGALDSTNAIDAPEAAVITNIGLEHTEYLGKTLAEIAEQKAGIIKEGCACVCYDMEEEALSVIERVCREKGVPLSVAGKDVEGGVPKAAGSGFPRAQELRYGGKTYKLALLGKHQLKNAAVALDTIETLSSRGFEVSDAALRAGLESVRWPARFELLSEEPVFILDGGHNPQCAEALSEALREALPGKKFVFLAGVLADKDYPAIIDRIDPLAAEYICVTPKSERALEAEEFAEFLARRGKKAIAFPSVEEGIKAALESALPVVAFGSLYMAGLVRSDFRGIYKARLRKKKLDMRNGLGEKEREEKSALICERIRASEEYKKAKTVLLYKFIGSEVRLDALERANEAAAPDEKKRFAYPLCGEDGKLLAIVPGEGADAWKKGAFGISEPRPEEGTPLSPEEIDMAVCPCVAFDGSGTRLGRGGGWYDRFLPGCREDAVISVAAYELQRVESLVKDEWDAPVDICFTEGE